jgi:hypothetical protein
VEKRLELRDGSQRARGLTAAGEQVFGPDLALSDASLHLAQRGVDQLTPARGAHHPTLGHRLLAGRVHLELEATIGALDRGPTI